MSRTTCEALIFAAVLMTTTAQDGTGKDWPFLTRHRQENKTQKIHMIEENNLQFVNLLVGNGQIHIHSFSLKVRPNLKTQVSFLLLLRPCKK